jgi:serine/threonine-protein kinase
MPRAPDLVGCALDGRYELLAVLGEGAFGRVYEGRDRRLARVVAVKVIKPWWAEDSEWVARFLREARMLARVNHPGIVQIFDFGDAEQGPYYVAELVRGESLAERLRRGPLPAGEAAEIAEKLALALGSAHTRGIVHCDVKPANVLLATAGAVKVGDFGVARLAESTSQGASATVAGTPRYMSPEQARGLPTTTATDVYATGVVLYEMLAGEPPFTHGSAVELALRHLQDPPPELPAEVPPELASVVATALAKDPEDRYPDAGAMAAALQAARAEIGEESAPAAGRRRSGGATALLEPTTTAAPGGRALAAAEPAAAAAARGAAPTERVRRRSVPVRPAAGPSGPPRGGPRRRTRRRALVALLAVSIPLAGGLVALLAGAAARTTVPDLRGLPAGGVRARAARADVHPAFSRRYAETAYGLATAQYPAPGTRVAAGTTVRVALSAGPPPVAVPDVVGLDSTAAESLLARDHLAYGVTLVPAPGAVAGSVQSQSPAAGKVVRRRSTIALDVAEAPRWRPLTTFSGVDDGESVPVQIRGHRWRVNYSMSYEGTCLLLVTCLGPSAQAVEVPRGSSFGGFELGEGESLSHTFERGPGLFRVAVSAGQDSAKWSMTIQDYY